MTLTRSRLLIAVIDDICAAWEEEKRDAGVKKVKKNTKNMNKKI